MISYIYTPVAGGSTKTVQLIDDDRHWPSPFHLDPSGAIEEVPLPRADSEQVIGRGNAIVPITFLARRQFTTVAACLRYIIYDVPAMCGTTGTLVVEPPGAKFRQINTCCKSAPGHNIGIMSFVQFTFIGPLFVLN